MANAKEVSFNLKVMMNKHGKVLLAEVDSNFVDVLLSFLTLPLGTIVRVLKNHYGDQHAPVDIGSLTTLYKGLANLESDHFRTEGCKQMLLNPRSSFKSEYRKMKLDINDTKPTKYFNSENFSGCCYSPQYFSIYYGTVRCLCGKMMTHEVSADVSQAQAGGDSAAGVFVNDKVSFLISDDLQIVPNVAFPIVQTLRNFGITDTDGAATRNVTFGFNEIMYLLKGSLISQTPTLLTDLIIKKRKREYSDIPRSEPVVLFHEIKRQTTSTVKKAVLNVVVQKSTNKVLFAQAEDDFVDFLCSLLTITLGGVECLLEGKSCLKSIDNLYRSIADLIDDKYIATPDIKKRLIKPKLTHAFMPKNQILPLIEQNVLHYKNSRWSFFKKGWITAGTEGHVNYVNGSKMYLVSDDLTVTPCCDITLKILVLTKMNVPLSDVKEVEVAVGLEEGLSILKASLRSTSALTNGLLINQVLMKQPKQERL